MNKDYDICRPFTSVCPWDMRDVIKAMLFYFFMAFIGSPILFQFISLIIGRDWVKSIGENSAIILFSLLVNILACLYVVYIICVEHKQPLVSAGLILTNWKNDIRAGIKRYLIAIPILMTTGIVVDLISKLAGSAPQQQEIVKRVLGEKSIPTLIFMITFGAIIAPVIEEFLFRGFLLTAMNKYFGRWKAILISSLVFASVHLNIHVFLQIFILGILLGYVFERTGSLVAPIAIHVIHNSATFAFLLYFKDVILWS